MTSPEKRKVLPSLRILSSSTEVSRLKVVPASPTDRLTREEKARIQMKKEQEELIRDRVSDPLEGFQWIATYEVYLEEGEFKRITGLEPFSN